MGILVKWVVEVRWRPVVLHAELSLAEGTEDGRSGGSIGEGCMVDAPEV